MSIRQRRGRVVAAVAIACLMPLAATTPALAAPRDPVTSLTKAVSLNGVLKHLRQFQKFADRNGGDRAAGRPGYQASVDYVVAEVTKAGYDVTVQEFPFEYTEDNSELLVVGGQVFEEATDFLRNGFTPTFEGTATGPLVPVDVVVPAVNLPPNSNSSGCEAADFAAFPAGGIALLQRGSCGFAVKVLNAQAAGAAGAVIFNEGQPGRDGLLVPIGDTPGLAIPVVAGTSAMGVALNAAAGQQVTVTVDFLAEQRTSFNVFAQSPGGDPNTVVMAGAHLDSVQEGPGINDNGSGSAGLLEVAIQYAKAAKKAQPPNAVRFAWWGAEEDGLLGSEYYVANLTPEQQAQIALYLNFDMIGSPNYQFGIYDGDDSSGTAPVPIPPGSAEIEDVFEKFYADGGKPFNDTEFSGRSDYGPFIAVGIPSGGLFTGAEDVKTPEQVALYGGLAGVAYDPCYHQACDSQTPVEDGADAAVYAQLAQLYHLRGNVNEFALDVNSDAVATSVITFAYDASTVTSQRAAAGGGGARVAGAPGGDDDAAREAA